VLDLLVDALVDDVAVGLRVGRIGAGRSRAVVTARGGRDDEEKDD
jgi:hypothetical protein